MRAIENPGAYEKAEGHFEKPYPERRHSRPTPGAHTCNVESWSPMRISEAATMGGNRYRRARTRRHILAKHLVVANSWTEVREAQRKKALSAKESSLSKGEHGNVGRVNR